MYVKQLELKNFRNYGKLSLRPSPGVNIFYGKNAQGKTNILEAMFLCGTSKSHRGTKDRDMIRFGEEESHIRMHVDRKGSDYRIDMHLKKNRPKGIAVSGVPLRKAGELFGIVHFVFFSPEDLNIIKNGPSERRRFLNFMLCETDPVYLSDYGRYMRSLQQRNRLLHEISYRPALKDELSVWDDQLVRYGVRIMEKRRSFIEQLQEETVRIHRELTGGQEEIALFYEPNTDEEGFAEKLKNARETDLRSKSTTAGPHRDDMSIRCGVMDLRLYGSQGQQRTAALSLKLSQIGMIEEKTREKPVLLLDDVLSELDRDRQTHLLKSIEGMQTMITCTGLDEFVENRFVADRVFQVNGGTLT